jgi:hypothetical protein
MKIWPGAAAVSGRRDVPPSGGCIDIDVSPSASATRRSSLPARRASVKLFDDPPRILCPAVFQDADAFINGAVQHDDMTCS